MKPLRAMLPALAVAAFWFACSADVPSTSVPVDPYPPKPCKVERDCLAPPTMLCGTRSCVEGLCQLEVYEQSRSDRRGDCAVTVCDSGGYGLERPDVDDFRDDGNPCTRDYCKETPQNILALNDPTDVGPVPNGSGLCDGRGNIVECTKAEDCGDSSLTCSRYGSCIPLACTNRALDEAIGESAVDCGGPCEGCLARNPCNSGTDCLGGVCGSDKRCAEPRCNDGVKNSIETDVDCGGTSCDPCAEGQSCKDGADCVNRTCFAGKCQPRTCDDHVRNGDEEDIDCGADCPPCQY